MRRLVANSVWLAQIIASWAVGEGALPDRLGLAPEQFAALLASHFPGYVLAETAVSGHNLDFSRMLEKQDLETLLRQFAAQPGADTEWLIALIVAACLGSDHLWQDLVYGRAPTCRRCWPTTSPTWSHATARI